MAQPGSTASGQVLSSKWEGLNQELIAVFYNVDRDGKRVDGSPEVHAPLIESSFETTFNWTSPFENSGTEQNKPMLAAMLQSGMLTETGITGAFGDMINKGLAYAGLNMPTDTSQNSLEKIAKDFEGRTGMTKLNSTQIFTGSAPSKFPCTAIFRAWSDAGVEVEQPVSQLMQWAFPEFLAESSTVLTRGAGKAVNDTGDWKDVLMPSKAPVLVAVRYKGRTYSPMVIESITLPTNSPINALGQHTHMAVQMSLATLRSWDRQDWMALVGEINKIKQAENKPAWKILSKQ